MLEIPDADYLSDTTNDIESIPDETLRPFLAKSPRGLETGFTRKVLGNSELMERVMDVDANETEEIVRGFILEKDIINEEHKKEKEQIIESLMKDREELIERFKEQVLDIERKVGKGHNESSRPQDSGIHLSNKGMPIYIRLDGNNVISAEEFLSRLQLEDKYETEKDTLERSFRDERRLLKEKLEFDYNRRLQQESSKFGMVVDELRKTIADLKQENRRLDGALKNMQDEVRARSQEMKSKWNNTKARLESDFLLENDKMRGDLEKKHAKEIEVQQKQYEEILTELKDDLREAGKSMARKEKEISMALNNVNDYEERVRKELSEKLQRDYVSLNEKLRTENERLSEQVDKLQGQKDELAGRIKELDNNNENKMSILNEFTKRLNSEYEERLKRTVLDNENLRNKLNELQNENRSQERALRNYEESTKQLEHELASKHGLIVGCEESKEYLRKEVKGFSYEIDILRREKEELQKSIEEYKNMESTLKNKISSKNSEANEALDRCKILERERLSMERKMALLGEEFQQILSEKETLRTELKRVDEETESLKLLLDEERREREHLAERFRRDAEEIRRKDNECRTLREKLRRNEDKIEVELTSDAERVDELMAMEAKNSELLKRLNDFEEKQEDILRKEREDIQKQFAREFAKRIQILKSNYEEATDGLKNEIRLLRSKINDLEDSMATRRSKNLRSENNEGLEINGRSDVKGRSGKSNKDIAVTTEVYDGKQNFDLGIKNTSDRSSSVRIFDCALNHGSNKAASENKSSTPVKDTMLWPTSPKGRNMESPHPIFQGAFSRQRSRSLEAERRRWADSRESERKHFESSKGDSDKVAQTRDHSYSMHNYPLTPGNDLHGRSSGHFKTSRESGMQHERGYSSNRYDKEQIVPDSKEFGESQNHEQYAQHYESNTRSMPGLPPKYRTNLKRSTPRRAIELGTESKSRGNGDSDTKRLERSVEMLQERLETSHSDLLQRLENMQNSSHASDYIPQDLLMQLEREYSENGPSNVHSNGVQDFSKKMFKGRTRDDKIEDRMNKEFTPHDPTLYDVAILEKEIRQANKYAGELEIQLKKKTVEADDAKEALRRVYGSQIQDASNCCEKITNIDDVAKDGNKEIHKREGMVLDKKRVKVDAVKAQEEKDATTEKKNLRRVVNIEARERFSDEMSV